MFKRYRNPSAVGWLGWFEDPEGRVTAFVTLDGVIKGFDHETCTLLG